MTKATEEDLATLHGAVCQALTAAVRPIETSVVVGEEVVKTTLPPSASHLMAAITMLKNNNVTADAGSNKDLMDLTAALKERRSASKRRLTSRELDEVADEFDRDLGGHLQ